MVERFLFWLVIKAFYFLKNKFPNGKIKNIELVEIDKLQEQIKNLDLYTSDEADEDFLKDIDNKINDLLKSLKDKLKIK